MHRTLSRGRNRRMRAAITEQGAAIAPAVTSELQRAALAAVTAWCSRPRRRTTIQLAAMLLDMADDAASLERQLACVIRVSVIMRHEQE